VNPVCISVKSLGYVPSIRCFSLTTLQQARYGFSQSSQYAFKAREVVGKSLRERLLGPTTGKPYIYGTYALAGASALGIGMLCYYGLLGHGQSSAMERSAMWPAYVRERLHTTYMYLGGSLVVTAGSAMAASRSPAIMALTSKGTLVSFIVTLGAIIATGTLARSIDYENTAMKHLAWLLHTGVMGVVLAPMVYTGGPALFKAAWYTAGLVAGLSLTAACAPNEKFLNMAGPLSMGLGVVFVSCIGSFFFPPHTALGASLASVIVYGGLILFSAFLLHDTQRVIAMAERTPTRGYQEVVYDQYGREFTRNSPLGSGGYDPINMMLSIYMDVLNIFIRMVMIMGGGQRRK